MSIIRVHLLISGRVQGVYYRRDSRIEALRLGLNGWVRNLPDSKVEIIAEGEEKKIEEFIRWCYEGPSRAIVREVKVIRERSKEEFETFRILR